MHGKRQTADRFMYLNIYIYIYVEVYQTKDLLSRDESIIIHNIYITYLLLFFSILPCTQQNLLTTYKRQRIDVRYVGCKHPFLRINRS